MKLVFQIALGVFIGALASQYVCRVPKTEARRVEANPRFYGKNRPLFCEILHILCCLSLHLAHPMQA